ncbi:aminodeoxychorismate synthase component I [Limnoglobus roseus]|uniref:aminodeoxychorismate synthase n=1 Tax=Limnoglobus roseus TaxID=2598579 RepID=A0A5C1AGX1_9BACT|nr:aminodeoxychorismate synthase component I [Limnoglobus roseus]QEL18461.1 aminodeoxychorismate synthase, component I [Limnoglobus roseus]
MSSLLPVVEELVPCPDPWDTARRLAHLPHLLFLDSADRHPERGRYSYVMADPVDWLTDPRTIFDELRFEPTASDPDLPPFQGGYAGLFGYDLAHQLERLPRAAADEFRIPPVRVGRYDWVIAFDHLHHRAWLIAHGSAREKVADIRRHLRRDSFPEWVQPHAAVVSPVMQYPSAAGPWITSNFSRDGYIAAVQRAIEYVRAGDIFQVNLSQRLLAPLLGHPLNIYGDLRSRCPGSFACYFDLGEFQIASASPEEFLNVNDGQVVTRPIKGTRPRGRTPMEDAARLEDLVSSPKDRAENVMIVDLLRNDLGRVCEYGTVRVSKVCEVESYNYVHHLVSEVRGRLRSGLTAVDLLRASFPGGSVTGAPKVRAMEIIAELEPTARGPYCGSVGYLGFNGTMGTNILIRTFTAGGGWLQFPVGGGIVADSDPIREYEETLHKAAGLLRALTP